MSVTKREVPFEVSTEGGFPSREELRGVTDALADVHEFGIAHLFQRINGPLVRAYEAEDEVRLENTYEDIGVLTVVLTDLEYWASEITEKLARLRHGVIEGLGDALKEGGRVESSPRYGEHGGDYVPSPSALERWGLAKRKADDAR